MLDELVRAKGKGERERRREEATERGSDGERGNRETGRRVLSEVCSKHYALSTIAIATGTAVKKPVLSPEIYLRTFW